MFPRWHFELMNGCPNYRNQFAHGWMWRFHPLRKKHHFVTKVNHCNLHLPGFESFFLCSLYFYLLSFSLFTYTIMTPLVPPSNFKWKIIFSSSTPSHVVNLVIIRLLQKWLNPCLLLLLHMNLPNKRNMQR